MEWDPFVKTVSKVSMATDHDVISLSFNCSNIIARAVQQIKEAFGEETKAIFSRQVTLSMVLRLPFTCLFDDSMS